MEIAPRKRIKSMNAAKKDGLQMERKIPVPVFLAATFTFVFAILFNHSIFNSIPHVHDEIDFIFQAKIFRLGKLYVPSPCAKESFDFSHMINNGKWYSHYTPGYPLLLLPGLIAGAPWLVNPFLGALSVFLFYFLGKEIYSRKTGILAAILAAVSIWFLVMSASLMSHTSSMFFISLFLLFLFKSLRSPSAANGFMAGFGLGMAVLIRPYHIILISLSFLIFYGLNFFRDIKKRFSNALALAGIAFLFLSLLLLYNHLTNGHPLRFGYSVSYGKEHGIGFGRTGYYETAHTPYLGFINIGKNLAELNSKLFGWPLSSLWPVTLLIFFDLKKSHSHLRKYDCLLFLSFISLALGLFFYWGAFPFFGARMFFDSLPLLLLLSSRGILELASFLSAKSRPHRNYFLLSRAIPAILVLFSLYGFLVSLPKWLWPKDSDWYFDRFSADFAGVNSKIHRALSSTLTVDSLVIIKMFYSPMRGFPHGWWGAGFLNNDPLLKGKIIYARDRGENNLELFPCFPQRKIYLYIGTLEKGMLFPLFNEKGKIILQEPLLSSKKGNHYAELINDPRNFFHLYSRDFEKFIETVFQTYPITELDVKKLLELGINSKEQQDYWNASFYFEAALQIEKNPEVRVVILNQLISCYIKTGQIDEAKKISSRTRGFTSDTIFNIIPERGF